MSTQASRFTMTLWRCAATLALALAVGHVSAQLAREPVDAGEQGRSVGPTSGDDSRSRTTPTKLSVSLTGTGVKATAGTPPSSPKPRSHPPMRKVKDSTTTEKKPGQRESTQ